MLLWLAWVLLFHGGASLAMTHLLHRQRTMFNCHVLDHKSSSNSTTKWRSGRSTKKRTSVMFLCVRTVTLHPSTSFALQHASYSRSGAQDRSKGGILKIKEIVNFGSIGNRSPPTFSLCLSITFFFSQVHEFCLLKNVDLIFDTFYARLRYLVMAFYLIKLHDLKDFFSVVLGGRREKICSFWILFLVGSHIREGT